MDRGGYRYSMRFCGYLFGDEEEKIIAAWRLCMFNVQNEIEPFKYHKKRYPNLGIALFYTTSVPPHSTTVKPVRSKAVISGSSTEMGFSSP